MKRTLFLTAFFGLLATAPALANGHDNFAQAWRRTNLPRCEDQTIIGHSIIVRIDDPRVFGQMRRIAPPGASVHRCTSQRGKIRIRVSGFRNPAYARAHARRLRAEIVQPFYQQIMTRKVFSAIVLRSPQAECDANCDRFLEGRRNRYNQFERGNYGQFDENHNF